MHTQIIHKKSHYLEKGMKSKTTIILLHILAWVLFLSLPILFSPDAPKIFRNEIGNLHFLPILLSSLTLIMIFYFNYFVLIPKFLFPERYVEYALLGILCIVFMFAFPLIVLSPVKSSGETVFYDPILRRSIPLVIANNLLMFFVVFFASIGLRLNNRWKETEKEKLSAQLSYLKTQINPHFLFNTLNSIYSVTIGKAPKGAEMVNQLSEMMRYTLKETQMDFVPLEKEIDYIGNYIDMQKLRFDDSVKFEYEVHGQRDDLEIAPLLLIPFIENVFKHGVNSEDNSDIKIKIEIAPTSLNLYVFNNKVEVHTTQSEKSGLGIENARTRLRLVYPDKHDLKIIETENTFEVILKINLV